MKSEILDQLPPNDRAAEQYVIGATILDGKLMDSVCWLTPEDFYGDDNRALWQAVQMAYRDHRTVDFITVQDAAKAAGDFERAGGSAHIHECVTGGPGIAGLHRWASIVKRHAKCRQIIHAATAMLQDGYDATREPNEILAACEASLAKVSSGPGDTDAVTAWDAVGEAMTQIETIIEHHQSLGVPTGLPAFDMEFGGLFPSELVILAARPGVGKSSLGMQIAFHNAMSGRCVYAASMEMTRAEIVTRELCAQAGVSSHRIRTGQITKEDQTALVSVEGDVAGAKLWLHDHPGLSVYDIRRAARRLVKEGLTLIVVDYLQLIRPEDRRAPREQQVSAMTRALKALAVELKVPVLCLSQLSREATTGGRPQLHHLRESGAIEQDASAVWFLHPEKTVGRDTDTVLIVAKNRSGETGEGDLCWVPGQTKYTCDNASKGQREPAPEPEKPRRQWKPSHTRNWRKSEPTSANHHAEFDQFATTGDNF